MIKASLIEGDEGHVYLTTDSRFLGLWLENEQHVGNEDVVTVNITEGPGEFHCQAQIKLERPVVEKAVVHDDGSVIGRPPLKLGSNL